MERHFTLCSATASRYLSRAGDNGPLEADDHLWLVLAMFVAAFVDLGTVTRIGGWHQRTGRCSALRPPLAAPAGRHRCGEPRRWYRAERALGRRANPAKHLYLAATAALIAVVLVDPIAGFAGYVGGHALEYFVIVHRSLRTRAAHGDPSAVAAATATAGRRAVTYLAYAVAIVALVRLSWGAFDGRLYGFLILFLGGLHVLYDGFIWKLRRPALAASLGVPSGPEKSTAASVA